MDWEWVDENRPTAERGCERLPDGSVCRNLIESAPDCLVTHTVAIHNNPSDLLLNSTNHMKDEGLDPVIKRRWIDQHRWIRRIRRR